MERGRGERCKKTGPSPPEHQLSSDKSTITKTRGLQGRKEDQRLAEGLKFPERCAGGGKLKFG